jgi:AcrR family transcriptional regulator
MDVKNNRQSWLTAGLQVLAAQGAEGLRVMPIAKMLGVTKGSFYWHFKNLEAFQVSLLEEWESCYTQQAIECVENLGGDYKTKLNNLFIGSATTDFTLARAIRSWSLTNQNVREVQARVDRQRLDYLEQLLQGVGWSLADATVLARWSYCAFIGYATLEGPTVTVKQLNLVLAILIPR